MAGGRKEERCVGQFPQTVKVAREHEVPAVALCHTHVVQTNPNPNVTCLVDWRCSFRCRRLVCWLVDAQLPTMIVVFVIDTSPSMGEPLFTNKTTGGNNMTKLDLAKMAVESMSKSLTKRVSEHNLQLQQQPMNVQKTLHNMGLGYAAQDQFLLLSTSRQYPKHPSSAVCGAGGRLLVGFGDYIVDPSADQADYSPPSTTNGSFDHELKHLQSSTWHSHPSTNQQQQQQQSNSDQSSLSAGAQPHLPFPEDAGGAVGLNIALSTGLSLLSRYRLKNRLTENFGMGRLPSPAMLAPSGSTTAVAALQPACLVLLTDGDCLRKPPSEGGGVLQLQKGSVPLREFYQEPFRWDQRIFCLGVGGEPYVSSKDYLHPSLRALCEVTGGCHTMLRSTTGLSTLVDQITKLMAPPRAKELLLPDPLKLPTSHLSQRIASTPPKRLRFPREITSLAVRFVAFKGLRRAHLENQHRHSEP